MCVCEQLICVGINRVYVYVLTGCIVVFIKTNQLCDVFIYICMCVCIYIHGNRNYIWENCVYMYV